MVRQLFVFGRVGKVVFREFLKLRERVFVHLILDHPRPAINNSRTRDT
jgi:hypothetical protein